MLDIFKEQQGKCGWGISNGWENSRRWIGVNGEPDGVELSGLFVHQDFIKIWKATRGFWEEMRPDWFIF